jgi:hypothetical protein
VWNPCYRVIFGGYKKTAESRSILFLAAREKPPQIGANNFWWLLNFGGLHKNKRKKL